MEILPKIKRYMTPIPFTIEAGALIEDAVKLMRAHGIRHLPVEEDDRIVGILSDWDIVSAPSLDEVMRQRVCERMTAHPYCVSAETPVETALRYMSENGIGSTVVTTPDERVIGIFTEKDAIRMFVEVMIEPEPQSHPMRLQ